MNEQNEQQISEKIKNIITQNLEQIQNDYKDNSVSTSTLIELNKCLFELKKEKIKTDFIYNQIQDEHLNVFLYLLQEEGVRSIVLKILRKNIEIYPLFTNKLLEKMFQIIADNFGINHVGKFILNNILLVHVQWFYGYISYRITKW